MIWINIGGLANRFARCVGEFVPHRDRVIAMTANDNVNVVAEHGARPNGVPDIRYQLGKKLDHRLPLHGIKPDRSEVQQRVDVPVKLAQFLPRRFGPVSVRDESVPTPRTSDRGFLPIRSRGCHWGPSGRTRAAPGGRQAHPCGNYAADHHSGVVGSDGRKIQRNSQEAHSDGRASNG